MSTWALSYIWAAFREAAALAEAARRKGSYPTLKNEASVGLHGWFLGKLPPKVRRTMLIVSFAGGAGPGTVLR